MFQQWEALLSNRNKRQRSGRFLIHGVRPITLAIEHEWPLDSLLRTQHRPLSDWAEQMVRRSGAPIVDVAPELLAELGERDSGQPELIAVGILPPDDVDRLAAGPDFLGVVFDRPVSPGNVGTLIRSADAFGASGIVVTGHAADIFDPKSVRASTGSLFTVPVVRTGSTDEVLRWVRDRRADGIAIRVVGTDEHGASDISEYDLTQPILLVIGNETTGMSARWRAECDDIVRIPIGGGASSLNAANAGTVVLYEAARQRGFRYR
ncbi:TrmH family RNA methyltransferase [Nocardia pseudobrasiliensis]|uniref:TrmH family RNA methyltransferase n=1 Tax=Nocardia pseudobrasiliensis TaxID=45979 RepID=A0A370I5S6_9NOCA|nr:TrmH family RNA methyltransferase [Nocardia pseudobrasiliensis]RDI66083.1 TrmH family RNA methyltransferase [Nocardia pseudobrasiliensis]